jgi:glycosyltransferase involved in cell wall biosynthesis
VKTQSIAGGLRTKGLFKATSPAKPLITVITVVLNGERHLEQAIQSVIKQDYPHIEYVIIDGGSTDGTLDIIRKYEARIDYWVSEPDNGIYDAMNKGIALARGELSGSNLYATLNEIRKISRKHFGLLSPAHAAFLLLFAKSCLLLALERAIGLTFGSHVLSRARMTYMKKIIIKGHTRR